jgi:hypothetical protein
VETDDIAGTTREELYRVVDAGRLVKFYKQTAKAVETQSSKLEQYDNSPYTRDNAANLAQSARALSIIGDELRQWHAFLHPEPPA